MSRPLALAFADRSCAIVRLGAGDPVPSWVAGARFASVTRTPDELSIVADDDAVPPEQPADRGWRVFRVEGAMPLALTGVLASIARPLADAAIPLFAIATHDTDYVLVPGARKDDAVRALAAAGHRVRDAG